MTADATKTANATSAGAGIRPDGRARSAPRNRLPAGPYDTTHHPIAQRKPRPPIRANAARQPSQAVKGATIKGVSTAPTAAPELKIPLPRPRSAGGRTVAVTRRAHGQLNDSPTPRSARKAIRAPSVGDQATA